MTKKEALLEQATGGFWRSLEGVFVRPVSDGCRGKERTTGLLERVLLSTRGTQSASMWFMLLALLWISSRKFSSCSMRTLFLNLGRLEKSVRRREG
jgi:hypothetical protein